MAKADEQKQRGASEKPAEQESPEETIVRLFRQLHVNTGLPFRKVEDEGALRRACQAFLNPAAPAK